MKQTRLTGFYNSATHDDQPYEMLTTGNSVAGNDHNSTDYLDEIVFEGNTKNVQLETVRNNVKEDCNMNDSTILDDRNVL